MDGHRGYYAKCNKTEKDNLFDLTYMWNLKNETNKTETDNIDTKSKRVVA